MSVTVALGLYRSWKSLPPSQGVRSREAERTRLVPLFATLAALGFSIAAYSSVQYATISYQVWADQRGIETPQRFVCPSLRELMLTSSSVSSGTGRLDSRVLRLFLFTSGDGSPTRLYIRMQSKSWPRMQGDIGGANRLT